MTRGAHARAQQVKYLLAELLCPARTIDAARIAALDAGAWQALQALAREHRVEPLLHWQLTHAHADLLVPHDVRAATARAFHKSLMRSLVLQAELLKLHRTLAQAGIPHLMLKGAGLAWHAYPHPALRPMRDLDVLVAPERALEAHALLLQNGLRRVEGHAGSAEAALQHGFKHLPPLRSANGKVLVEVHARLTDAHAAAQPLPDLADAGLWARSVTASLAGVGLPVPSPTDILLHVIDHGVYTHQFDNGPLLLGDIAFLLATRAIDWPLFWRLARQAGRSRGCVLCLRLAERYWGPQPIQWPQEMASEHPCPDDQLRDAMELMLMERAARWDVLLSVRMTQGTGLRGKLRLGARRVFMPRALVAARYPVAADSPRVFLWYPACWWGLARQYLPGVLRRLWAPQQRAATRQAATLQRWLVS